MKYFLPHEIKENPEIEAPIEGIRGWKVGSEHGLVVFLEIQPGTDLPEHSHCFQWGVVMQGTIELTIDGVKNVFGPGDSYVIPENVPHSARIPEGAVAMDYFADPSRY